MWGESDAAFLSQRAYNSKLTLKVPPKREPPCLPKPGVAIGAVVMEEPALVSQAPAHSYRTPYLGIHTEDKLSPVVVALHTVDLEGSRTAPYRVLDIRTFEVVFEIGKGVSHTAIQAIDVVLVAQQVEVAAYSSVGCRRLVVDLGAFVCAISFSYTYFYYREILVLEVDTQCRLILTVVADHELNGANQVCAYRHVSQQWDGVLVGGGYLLA